MIETLKQIQQCLKDKMYAHAEMYLHDAIAELESQEPVALVIDGVLVKSELPEKYTGHLYTHPPQRTEQEPMAWYCCFQGQEEGEFFLFGSPNSERYPSQYKTPLYEHLTQRTWVGLTDDDIDFIYTGIRAVHHDVDSYVLCRAVEAKLKDKNS
jgi:hypothetical protein